MQWQRGEGKWVRTDKPRRRYAWIDDMNKTIYVAWAKSGKVGKERMRVAVVGGFFKWEGEEGDVRDGDKEESVGGERKEERDEEETRTPESRRVREVVVRRSKPRLLRPRIGPTTSTTSTPRQDKAEHSRTDEDTRARRVGFFPRQGIG